MQFTTIRIFHQSLCMDTTYYQFTFYHVYSIKISSN